MSPNSYSFIPIVMIGLITVISAQAQSTEGPLSGAASTNVSLGGSSASWSGTNAVFSSDNSYASSSLSSNGDFTDYLQVTNFGFNVSTSYTIVGIEVEIEKLGDKVKDNQVRIVKGGSIGTTDQSATANWPNTDPNTYTLYGASNDLWGETWTSSDINSAGFGIAISARRLGGGGGAAVPNIDHIRITVYFEIPLPVKLTHFSGRSDEQEAHLSWETGWEEGNSHFEVQRSIENLRFETIGFVPGGNNSYKPIPYQFVDPSPSVGNNYYRLKQHDFNGMFAYSEVVRVRVEAPTLKYHIPTFVRSSATLTINSPSPEAYLLHILDKSGKRIRQIHPRSKKTLILREDFPRSGIYFYRLTYKNQPKASGKIWVY